jgi:hypothetical protein
MAEAPGTWHDPDPTTKVDWAVAIDAWVKAAEPILESVAASYGGSWKGSITQAASGSSSLVAVLNPVNPSIATTSTPARHVSSRSASQLLTACLERPRPCPATGPAQSRPGSASGR